MMKYVKYSLFLLIAVTVYLSCRTKKTAVIDNLYYGKSEVNIPKTKNSLKLIYSTFASPSYGYYPINGSIKDYEIWKGYYGDDYRRKSYPIDSIITYDKEKIKIFKEALDSLKFEKSHINYYNLKNAFVLRIGNKVDTFYITAGFRDLYKVNRANGWRAKQQSILISSDFYKVIPKSFTEKLYEDFYNKCPKGNFCKEAAYYHAGYEFLK